MAPRSFWKGYLKLSLVTCQVAMVPATSENEKVRFHTLNRKTGNRVVSRYVDAVTGDPVEEEDEAKAYPRGEDDHLILEDDELDAVALESTRTIDIEMFVPRDTIGWIWYDTPHYLTPADPVGEEAFSVIREAMAATGKVGISRLVMYRRERAVMLEPRGKGIIVWTLRYGDEVRDAQAYFDDIRAEKPAPKLLSLVKTLIEERTRGWDPSLVGDPVQDRLLDLIAAKKKGRKRPAKAKATPDADTPGNVINIMDALKKSLAAKGKAAPKRR
ncbi:Ku protein [Nitrospirillum iridis]|uniref:Non-homologous end joining protein Ku n=1 Tax=Nitrospirillum iridis TaxID=765888 RepID=A0A7X0AZH3_9PROT|nr:Ku protein [Nitrospirillum iridis]MBB6252997.1 DNA end-binding protein Ku [Nitrospirillum iridis]